MTTVNVYELEGYTELAHKLTGVEVRCTVPADTLELADEVRLIDVTPEIILGRLQEGHLDSRGARFSVSARQFRRAPGACPAARR